MERPKYERKMWYDKSDTTNRIPISPDNLNRIEDGIEEALEGCAENKEQMNLKINSLIDNINSSLAMCRRDNDGVCLYTEKKILNEEQLFEWVHNDITITVNQTGSVYVSQSHDIDECSFKLNLIGTQPTLSIYVKCKVFIDVTKNKSNVTVNYPAPSIYYFNEQGEKTILPNSGYLTSHYDTATGKTYANGIINYVINSYNTIKYIFENNPEFYIMSNSSFRWDAGTYPASKTIDAAVSFTLQEVICTEAIREKIDNIIL